MTQPSLRFEVATVVYTAEVVNGAKTDALFTGNVTKINAEEKKATVHWPEYGDDENAEVSFENIYTSVSNTTTKVPNNKNIIVSINNNKKKEKIFQHHTM